MKSTPNVCLCLACRHVAVTEAGLPACAAFPDGIPWRLLEDWGDHRYPCPGDRGVRFEPAAGVPAVVLAELEEAS